MHVYLTKSNVSLDNFLAKVPAAKRPLAETPTFERIAKARDAKYKGVDKICGYEAA